MPSSPSPSAIRQCRCTCANVYISIGCYSLKRLHSFGRYEMQDNQPHILGTSQNSDGNHPIFVKQFLIVMVCGYEVTSKEASSHVLHSREFSFIRGTYSGIPACGAISHKYSLSFMTKQHGLFYL